MTITCGPKRILLFHRPEQPNEWYQLELLTRDTVTEPYDSKRIRISPDELALIVSTQKE